MKPKRLPSEDYCYIDELNISINVRQQFKSSAGVCLFLEKKRLCRVSHHRHLLNFYISTGFCWLNNRKTRCGGCDTIKISSSCSLSPCLPLRAGIPFSKYLIFIMHFIFPCVCRPCGVVCQKKVDTF